jgi:hypothetical protein
MIDKSAKFTALLFIHYKYAKKAFLNCNAFFTFVS